MAYSAKLTDSQYQRLAALGALDRTEIAISSNHRSLEPRSTLVSADRDKCVGYHLPAVITKVAQNAIKRSALRKTDILAVTKFET
jgi:hypothetical protein